MSEQETVAGKAPGTAMEQGLLARLSGLRDYMLIAILAVIWLFFSIATDGIFLTPRNLVLLALQTSIVSLAAIPAVLLIVTRNFDLSVGSAVALVGVVVAVLAGSLDVSPLIAVPAAKLVPLVRPGVAVGGRGGGGAGRRPDGLPPIRGPAGVLLGMLMGAWQGWWVTKVGVSSFIVTLAGMLYFRGFSMIATNGATIASLPRALTKFATGFLPPVPSALVIVAALLIFAALRYLELDRSRQLGVIANLQSALVRALAPAVIAAVAALLIASW